LHLASHATGHWDLVDMFEPHLDHQAGSSSSYHDDDKPSLLDELDKIAPIKSFDAFPKVCRESPVGLLTRPGPINVYRALTPRRRVDCPRLLDNLPPGLGKRLLLAFTDMVRMT
jgi:hypothetical protein